jgi:hypothetical protein
VSHSHFHAPGSEVRGQIFFGGLRLNALYTVIVKHVGVGCWPSTPSSAKTSSNDDAAACTSSPITIMVEGEEARKGSDAVNNLPLML